LILQFISFYVQICQKRLFVFVDANEAIVQLKHDKFDTPVQSVDYFLAVKIHKTRHEKSVSLSISKAFLFYAAYLQPQNKTQKITLTQVATPLRWGTCS